MANQHSIEVDESTIELLRKILRPIVEDVVRTLALDEPARDLPSRYASPSQVAEVDGRPRPRRSQAPDGCLTIGQVSARTGHSPQRIRTLRVEGHELYSKAWKAGNANSSPLIFDEADVDSWVASRRQAGRH